MPDHIIVVGGGLCGLSASLHLARAGKTVTLFEKSRMIGGRAITQQRHGFRFNLGPHALYRAGASARVLGDLGIPVEGGVPPPSGTALYRGGEHKLPTTFWSLLTTSLVTERARVEAASFLRRLPGIRASDFSNASVREWLDRSVDHPILREFIEALVRLSTYSNLPNEQSAGAAIAQLQIAIKGVLYVHEGWQRLVDSLYSAAVSAGVSFVTSSRVVRVVHDGSVRGIELGELEEPLPDDTNTVRRQEFMEAARGTRLRADNVLLAIDPATASTLIGEGASWKSTTPVRLACLDVALSSLPKPGNKFALGIDQPIYFSVHSAWAHLAPKGGALIHAAKYLGKQDATATAESELEAVLDQLQRGWRDRLVHRRFLPYMTVSNALVRADAGGHAGRPSTRVTGVKNLLIAGDWVGKEGMLSDASLASSQLAAQEILVSDNN